MTLARVCDLASAMGMRDAIEYGPGRHGLAPQHFLYLRDPDGHRAELVSHGYQLLDPEVEPVGWLIDDPRAVTTWGPMPPHAWMQEASEFSGIRPSAPVGAATEDATV
jgi:catechol 2,3-dioxygenase